MLCYNVITLFNDKYNKYILKKAVSLPEPFLSCSVPYLKFNHFVDHVDDLWAKLNTNGVIWFILD